jgi:predicted Fe-Mo cluster-binding NifX family protein
MRKGSVVSALLVFLLLCLAVYMGGQDERPLKIAVAADGKTIDAQVEYQGGRCPWLLFFDGDGELTEVLENPYQQKMGQSGVNCAAFLAEKQVILFVAGNVGGRMAEALEQRDIQFMAFSGTVKDAVAHALKTAFSF